MKVDAWRLVGVNDCLNLALGVIVEARNYVTFERSFFMLTQQHEMV